ncbi:Crp/Fnr family transcriptional regulator [Ramlibacter sp. USB13]|uniref:Crp/Fnr family transcriptional regulator n=1 Tax=Ramlibacter cellulosilyticus TaxID=2764187 RepID=A0A923MP94_9BURK|nr:Crp/Fnr family transcriptional regulator [Ramlibacter cellulosilyticus]MBC5781342.1 Crp/Fnr family transcriptional regulator [Ramlibacter cellulosilyticus]
MEAVAVAAQHREAIGRSRWFAALPAVLRHDLLRSMVARRYRPGEAIFAQGDAVEDWLACATGCVRLAQEGAGRPLTLAFVGAGRWFGDAPLAHAPARSHDAWAHEETVVLAVSREKLRTILCAHPTLYEALAALQALRLRQVFSLVGDLNRLTLRARLAKHLAHLMRHHGTACGGGREVRLAIRLRQDQLAELLGCSRQRVNEQLAHITREQVIRREAGCLVIRDPQRLQQLALA